MSSIVNPTTPEFSEPLPNGGFDIKGLENQENVLEGSENADVITGGNLDDILGGIGGNDTISGGAGNDEIDGGEGQNIINGGDGDDTLIAGARGNILTGGAGEDVFRINLNPENSEGTEQDETVPINQITDFTPGEDKIVLQGLEPDQTPIYDSETGILSVDDVDIAQLSAGLNIQAEDIEVAGSSNNNSSRGEATVFRFFDSSVGSHFYTADEVERDAVQDNLPNYSFEGESYRTVDATTGAQEVYRFFNPDTGVHLYTTDEVERDSIIDTLPNFEFEGVKFYAYETQVEGSIPVYRFYEPTLGVHFYTPDEAEKDAVQANLANYNFEGIAYYALPVDESVL